MDRRFQICGVWKIGVASKGSCRPGHIDHNERPVYGEPPPNYPTPISPIRAISTCRCPIVLVASFPRKERQVPPSQFSLGPPRIIIAPPMRLRSTLSSIWTHNQCYLPKFGRRTHFVWPGSHSGCVSNLSSCLASWSFRIR